MKQTKRKRKTSHDHTLVQRSSLTRFYQNAIVKRSAILFTCILLVGFGLVLYLKAVHSPGNRSSQTVDQVSNLNISSIMSQQANIHSPNTTRVAFEKQVKLYGIDLNGSNMNEIFDAGKLGLSITRLAISPSGSRIAILANDKFILVNSDGSDMKEISSRSVVSFVWSPDERYIVYAWQKYPSVNGNKADDTDLSCVKGGCALLYAVYDTTSGTTRESADGNGYKSPDLDQSKNLQPYFMKKAPYPTYDDLLINDPVPADDKNTALPAQDIYIHSNDGKDKLILSSSHNDFYHLVGYIPSQALVINDDRYSTYTKQTIQPLSPAHILQKRDLSGANPVTLVSSDEPIRYFGPIK